MEYTVLISKSGIYKIVSIGKRNPRLLEWLDEIAAREKEFDFAELKKQVHGKNEEFVNKYLADILAKTEGKDFHLFLQKAAVYRIPLPASAFACCGGIHFLKTAASLTLMEKEVPGERELIYWVTPVIREQEFFELEQSIRKETHKAAYEWYDSQYKDADEPVPEQSEETVFHALACGNVRGACKHGVFVWL